VTTETVIAVGSAADDIGRVTTKAILLLEAKEDRANAAFGATLIAIANTLPARLGAGRVTVAVPDPAAYPGGAKPPFDAVIEIGFDTEAALHAAWERQGAALLQELSSAAALPRSRGFLAREERVIWPPFGA